MLRRFIVYAAFAALSTAAADKVPVARLLELAAKNPDSAEFRAGLLAAMDEGDVKKGTAVLGERGDFLWAIESPNRPDLFVDDVVRPAMKRLAKSNIWFTVGKLRTGTSHSFHYVSGAQRLGGRTDVPSYGSDSYEQPGIPQGKLSEKLTHTSKIYEGMVSDYWIYVPAQYNPKIAAALMVWQDGQGHVDRNGGPRTQNVIDNLIHQKKIPVMIQVFISPGKVGEKAMRSILYDTVSDKYATFLRDEILADVQSKYNLRKDGYSRGIAGNSSGGICAFNVAWHQPDQFSRVLSRIGSFTSIQWRKGEIDGGNVYPFKIRKEPKRNIRTWLQDGSEDLENAHGSWPLQNIQMANSLKYRDYDFHFSFGNGTHNGAHGNAEAPESLTWLWREYDPARTEQTYEIEKLEKAKPMFRVRIYNRDVETSDAR